MLILSEPEQIIEPYSKLAYIYDDVMAYVNYKQWAQYIQRIIKKWYPQTTSILDISCGTGTLLLKLDSKKYQLVGLDLSFDMLKVAKRKLNKLNPPIPLWRGDMAAFKLSEKVDTIICSYDSINYLLTLNSWSDVLTCVYEGLNYNGLFIFDICTERNSREFFHNYFETKNGKSYSYTRQSNYNSKERIHTNRFVIHFDGDRRTYVEIHRQRIFSLKEILDLIETTRFQLLAVMDDFTFNQGTEKSLRIHFVLKKNGYDDSII